MADLSIDEFQRIAAPSSRSGEPVAGEARAHFDRGTAWARIGAYEQALHEWKGALRLAPHSAEIHAALGSVYMALGCWQEAAWSFQRAVQAAPHLIENHYGLGSAYGRLGEYGQAIEVYEQAFKLITVAQGLGTETAVVSIESTTATPLPLQPEAFQERLRPDVEGFDFSALLSSPAARRKAARKEQSENSSVAHTETAPPSGDAPAPDRHVRGRGTRD